MNLLPVVVGLFTFVNVGLVIAILILMIKRVNRIRKSDLVPGKLSLIIFGGICILLNNSIDLVTLLIAFLMFIVELRLLNILRRT